MVFFFFLHFMLWFVVVWKKHGLPGAGGGVRFLEVFFPVMHAARAAAIAGLAGTRRPLMAERPRLVGLPGGIPRFLTQRSVHLRDGWQA